MRLGQSRRRSEKIRRRLKEESKTWIDQASNRITESGNSGSPIFNQQSANAGSSSYKHAKKINRFFKVGWRLLSFFFVGAFSFAIYTAWTSPIYKVPQINIKGLQRINEEKIQDELNIVGQQIFALEPSRIKNEIEQKYPELKNVKVSLGLPAQVSIDAIERQPVIAWQFQDSLIWIDSEGFLIPARGDIHQMLTIKADAFPSYNLKIGEKTNIGKTVSLDKPAFKKDIDDLVFFSFPKQIDGNLLTAILQLNAWMPDESILLYQAKRGIGWKDIRGWDVFIGSKLENINDKMLMYETIVKELDQQEIQPSMVSVEFLHAPYFRLEE